LAKTNRKIDEFYRKKPAQSDAAIPLIYAEEEKKQAEAKKKAHDESNTKE
jgi:hypothetical protein